MGRLLPYNFHKWGHMTNFKLDSQNQTIQLSLELKGEEKPVEVEVKYHLSEENGKTQMVIDQVITSREWLSVLLNEIALKQNSSLELPSQAAVLLRGVLK